MQRSIAEFRWPVQFAGFQIVELTDAGQTSRWLGTPASSAKEFRVYEPLTEEPSLFHKFAALDRTDGEIMGFASQYGRLGLQPGLSARRRSLHLLERVSEWRDEIKQLKNVILLAEAVLGQDLRLLRQYFVISRKTVRVTDHEPVFSRQRDRVVHYEFEELDAGSDRGRILEAAGRSVARQIDERLAIETSTQVAYVPSEGRASVRIAPRTLRGAIWYQAAQFLSRDRQHSQCETCREWFPLSTDTYRSDRRYCSDRCRSKAYRDRKRAKPK